MQPKVSVVVPVWNKLKFIEAHLRSLHGQTWDNVELVFVNDGSTDGTRGVLGEWEPRFLARGFEVVIIDQENGGINAAVAAGFQRMTGDFFCCVDCDDELHPAYVSKLARALLEHPDCMWAGCDYDVAWGDDGVEEIKPALQTQADFNGPDAIVNYLFLRSETISWIYMIRRSYAEQCGVIAHFPTSPRACQEPGLLIPLLAGGGRVFYLDDVLYRHNQWGIKPMREDYAEKVPDYDLNYPELCRIVLDRLDMEPEQKRRLLCIQQLAALKFKFIFRIFNFREDGLWEREFGDITAFVEHHFSPAPAVDPARVRGHERLFFAALENAILHIRPKPPTGRVFAYGALGRFAQRRLPPLLGTPLEPDFLWDIAAGEHSEAAGLPVTRPDFAALAPDDTVILFPRVRRVWRESVPLLHAAGVSNILSVFDLDDSLSAARFPQFSHCTFTP